MNTKQQVLQLQDAMKDIIKALRSHHEALEILTKGQNNLCYRIEQLEKEVKKHD